MSNLKTLSNHSAGLKLLGHLGALITVCAWGSSFVFTKVLMEDGGFTPVEMFIYRFFAAWLILFLFTFRKLKSNSWRDELTLAICGMCSGSIYFILENYALQNTATGNVSLLGSISPLFTAMLMAAFYGQKLKIGVVTGSIIAFVGVTCIIFSSGEGFEIHPAGDLLAVCASLAWAVYSVLVKRIIPLYNSFFITRKLFFYGVLSAVPLLLAQNEPYHFAELFDIWHPKYLLNFLFLVVMCSVVGYLIWNEAMKILGPVSSNNYIYLQPLVTMVLAYFVFDERILLLGYIGCVLIIGGLIVSDKWNPDFSLRRPRVKRGSDRPPHS